MKALLFDMDNTLLDIDFDAFMQDYLEGLTAFYSRWAPEADVRRELQAGIHEMVHGAASGRTIYQRFVDHFFPALNLGADAYEALWEYYATEYPRLARWAKPMPFARELVQTAFDHGLIVVIATGPLFPEVALRERLRWAGIDDFPYRLITSAEVMVNAKPFVAYYEEVARHIGIPPQECLMIGDETVMDGAAALAGMQVLLVGPDQPAKVIQQMAAEGGDIDVGRLPRLSGLKEVYDRLVAQGIFRSR